MKSLGTVIGAVALLCCVVGCEDDRPVYAPPLLPAAKTATLQGGWGSYIEEVDGARVADANMRLANFGGNQVIVTAGTHNLVVVHEMSGGSSGTPASGLNFNVQATGGPPVHEFSFRCEAGHTYEMLPAGFWKPNKLRVTDKNTNQSLDIDDEDSQFMVAKH